jgi:hypothetical protein
MKSYVLFCSLLFSLSISYSQSFVQPGNRWDFVESWFDGLGNGESETVIYVASSDILLNGKYYHKVRPYYQLFPEYFRVDSAGIWVYSTECSQEWLYYSYSAPVGEEYLIPLVNCDTLESAGIMRKEIDTTGVFFGKTTRLMSFSFVPPLGDGYWITISPDFGFTGYSSFFYIGSIYKSLRGCVINEVVYGTLLSADEDMHIPEKFILNQNYPNPFNPSTTISFGIPVREKVQILVYDVLGREVSTLVNEEKPAGEHSVSFDAAGLASGMYYYRIRAGEFSETRKMLLIK